MKKFILLFSVITPLVLASCSGKGAYTKEEKQSQDSMDEARQEEGFGALESMSSDSGQLATDSTKSDKQ